MAKLLSRCPKCGALNEVINTTYMRLDEGTSVGCEKCRLRFHAKLSEEDIVALFEDDATIPKVKGKENYILKSEYYPK